MRDSEDTLPAAPTPDRLEMRYVAVFGRTQSALYACNEDEEGEEVEEECNDICLICAKEAAKASGHSTQEKGEW